MWLSYASGLFHCKGEQFCLPHDKVCDGQIQCMKFREDEKYCAMTGKSSLVTTINSKPIEYFSIKLYQRIQSLSVLTNSFVKEEVNDYGIIKEICMIIFVYVCICLCVWEGGGCGGVWVCVWVCVCVCVCECVCVYVCV